MDEPNEVETGVPEGPISEPTSPDIEERSSASSVTPAPEREALMVMLGGLRSLSLAAIQGLRSPSTAEWGLTFSGLVALIPTISRLLTVFPSFSDSLGTEGGLSLEDLEAIGRGGVSLAADVLREVRPISPSGGGLVSPLETVLCVLSLTGSMAATVGRIVSPGVVKLEAIPSLFATLLSVGPTLQALQNLRFWEEDLGASMDPVSFRTVGHAVREASLSIAEAWKRNP